MLQLAHCASTAVKPATVARAGRRQHSVTVCSAKTAMSTRRDIINVAAASGALMLSGLPAIAAEPKVVQKLSTSDLCDEECFSKLASAEVATTSSGLKYQDIVVGRGISPPVGYQVVVHYVAMTPEGRVFDSSLTKGAPYDVRVGAGQVIPGLDEGLLTMKVGGVRRMFIPGELAFPKGVPAAAGRPRVPPSSPVVFDVQLLYVPGFDEDDE